MSSRVIYVTDAIPAGSTAVASPVVSATETVPTKSLGDGTRRAARRRRRDPDWFAIWLFLVPQEIREPWAGDLSEDRAKMVRRGEPRWRIEVCTMFQLLMLLGLGLRNIIVETVAAALRGFGNPGN